MSNKVSKLLKRIKDGDWNYLRKRLLPRGNPILYIGSQLVFELTDTEKFNKLYTLVNKMCDHDIKIVQDKDVPQLCATFPESAELFKRRFAEGHKKCYVSLKNGEMTAHLWVTEPQMEYFNTNSLWKFYSGVTDAIWCFDGYVKPEHRMRGLFPYLMGAIRNDYLTKGYRTQFGETDANNDMSLNTHLKVGYEIIWRITIVSILGLKIYFARNEQSGNKKISFRYALNIKNRVL
ncbi:hypothetical protein NBRC116494_16750 [Aurantivibrio plasticivorans]